jgi:preprotein translocase subunit YajC
MDHLALNVLFAMGQPPQPGQAGPSPLQTLVPMLALVGIFYFAMIRPQQKKAKDHAELLKTVRPGDKVVTSGGVVGTVVNVKEKEKTLTLRSADAKMEITKSAIAEILERAGQSEPSS